MSSLESLIGEINSKNLGISMLKYYLKNERQWIDLDKENRDHAEMIDTQSTVVFLTLCKERERCCFSFVLVGTSPSGRSSRRHRSL